MGYAAGNYTLSVNSIVNGSYVDAISWSRNTTNGKSDSDKVNFLASGKLSGDQVIPEFISLAPIIFFMTIATCIVLSNSRKLTRHSNK
jgi:hypothetical protein